MRRSFEWFEKKIAGYVANRGAERGKAVAEFIETLSDRLFFTVITVTDELNKVLQKDYWNDYEIRCEGRRIRLSVNGLQTVDYTEENGKLPQFGLLGVQIHGGAIAEASYKEITIEELP